MPKVRERLAVDFFTLERLLEFGASHNLAGRTITIVERWSEVVEVGELRPDIELFSLNFPDRRSLEAEAHIGRKMSSIVSRMLMEAKGDRDW